MKPPISPVIAVAGILSALFIFACSSTVPTRTSHTAHNLLENGTFEEGMKPWCSLEKPNWRSFSIEDELLDRGRQNHFARTSAVTETPYRKLRISGAMQELNLQFIPSRLSFRMRITRDAGSEGKVYAQAVVIAWPKQPGEINRQIRYILHGVDQAPYRMTNARFIMVPPPEEKEGWRSYSLEIGRDFTENYPQIDWFSRIRILLETRYDNLPPGTEGGEVLLEVDYDDVVLIP